MLYRHHLIALLTLTAITACSDTTEPQPAPVTANLTVNAAGGWAYVDLNGTTAGVVTVATPAESQTWDIGFNATSVSVNGGTAGPGGVEVMCLCQNTAATSAQVMAFTATNQLAAFEAVTAADIPATSASWSAETFATSRWYRYNLTGTDHQVWPTFDVYLVRRGNDVYKLQLTNYYGPGGEPRQISFRYAKLR